jgi:hypothetical protein
MGPVRVSWRWEVGLPLLVLGALLAGTTVGAPGSELLFWAGAALAALGAAAFFSAPRRP